MTSPVDDGGGAVVDSRVESSVEKPLPLRELERALGPIRRVVRFALTRGPGAVRYLGANLAPHVLRARALDLPGGLSERIAIVASELDGFDTDTEEGQRARLSRLFAELARIDALAGLPLTDVLRPVQKVVQVDVAEEERYPTEPASQVMVASAPVAQDEDEDDDEEDDEPDEFTGDLSMLLVDLSFPGHEEFGSRFAATGVETVRDLVLIRPKVAERLEPVHGAGRLALPDTDRGSEDAPPGRAAAGGRVRTAYSVFHRGHATERWSILVGGGSLRVRWGLPAPAGWREIDRRVVVAGTFEATAAGAAGALVDAEIVVAEDQVVRLASWGLSDIPDRVVRTVLATIAEGLSQVRDPVSPELLRRLDLAHLGAAIAAAHVQLSESGRRRLALDELLLAQLAGILPRLQAGRERGIAHAILHGFAGRLGQICEFDLYDDAQTHLEEIKRDLRRSAPMRRVLTGEVGAGKGRIALLAAAMVAEAKSQVLIVGSDTSEIESRFLHTEPLLAEGGLVARLVTSAPTRNQLDAIKRGEVHVVFGTLDLLEQPIEYRRLGLVIAIEREQFGRASVLHANLPAPRPDLLVTTAIPVGPRVLLTAYADHNVSVVVDPHRRPAKIALCRPEDRADAYQRVREVVEARDQAMVVFPMVDGADAMDLQEALRLVRVLESDALAGVRVGLLHGAMSHDERARTVSDFEHRRLDVLVSTTRVEDGPSIPGASLVVIEQADRVDQWRLHRIIGFMSRAQNPASAILVVGEMAEPDAAARIERVVSAPNGFQLTEALVRLRGVERAVAPGSAPMPTFRWFDIDTELPLLLAAREEAHRIVRADPLLRRGVHGDLGRELRLRWDHLFPGETERGWVCSIRDEGPAEPKRRRRRRRRRKTPGDGPVQITP